MSKLMLKTILFFPIAAGLLAAPGFAQETDRYLPVKAPYAQSLVRKTMAAHPEMAFIGLHVIPPGRAENLIIACTDTSKVGKVSTDRDLEVVKTKGTKVQFNKARNYYELDQWFSDAAGNTLGMIVYHFAATRATSEQEAVKYATAIRVELQESIPNRERLFKE
jgi:hypothetical protein